MKKITKITYICDICGCEYTDKEKALKCEKSPIRKDKGVKVGDLIKIIRGDGDGELAVVRRLWVADPYWGQNAAEKYAHTRVLEVDLMSGLSRTLAFDYYEITNYCEKN